MGGAPRIPRRGRGSGARSRVGGECPARMRLTQGVTRHAGRLWNACSLLRGRRRAARVRICEVAVPSDRNALVRKKSRHVHLQPSCPTATVCLAGSRAGRARPARVRGGGAARPGAGGLRGPAGPLTLERLSRLPLAFEPAAGAPDAPTAFVAHAPGGALAFAADGVAMTLAGAARRGWRGARGPAPGLRRRQPCAHPAGRRAPAGHGQLPHRQRPGRLAAQPADLRRHRLRRPLPRRQPGLRRRRRPSQRHVHRLAGADPTAIRWAYQGARA